MRISNVLGLVCLAAAVAAQGSVVLVFNPAALGSNDSVNWSQLGGAPGGAGDSISSPFTATSSGGVTVNGTFAGGGGTVGVVCPFGGGTNCNWDHQASGFADGDTLVWTEDSGGNPSGPLTLTFSSLMGVGAYIQENQQLGHNFTAGIQVYDSSNNLLGSGTSGSDANGDPTFIGMLDTSPEIAKVIFSISSCTAFGCDSHDFAIDTLELNTGGAAVPEPSALISSLLLIGLLIGAKKFLTVFRASSADRQTAGGAPKIGPTLFSVLLCMLAVFVAIPRAWAQEDDSIPVDPSQLQVLSDQAAKSALAATNNLGAGGSSSTPLTIWVNQVLAYDGNTYTYSMVGRNPFANGARTTTIPVVLIPLVIKISTFVFDPTAPDDGCLGASGNTAFGLTQGSPIFQNAPFTMNGVNVGNTQFVDAFQRANFWQFVKNTGNAYHTILSPTVAPTQMLTYASANSTTSAVFSIGGTQCGSSAGPVNQKARLGVVNINVLDGQLQTIITNLGLGTNQFPLFIIYKDVISNGAANNLNNCCILGYHNSLGPSVFNPGQTFGIAEFDTGTVFTNTSDASVLGHEVAEWMDDPSGGNPTPAWGNIGQVQGACQPNLEVGDPLTGGANFFTVPMANGFTYHFQDLAFFSWFYAGTNASIGAGGKFSADGTFSGGAKPCPPGGTN